MVNAANLFFQFLDSFAFIVLSAIGLAIIFGMMDVINLAHGEFIMIGAYGTTLAANAGLPLPVAIAIGVAFGWGGKDYVRDHIADWVGGAEDATAGSPGAGAATGDDS